MAGKGVAERPSKTAGLAALNRALAHREYAGGRLGPDYLAEAFLPRHIGFLLRFARVRARGRQKIKRYLPGMHAYIIARTAFFDDAFSRGLGEGVPQIVLMGAGYDTQAFRFAAQNRGARVYELDAPFTQGRKLACLKKAGIKNPEGLVFVPIDFEQQTMAQALSGAGWQEERETLFLWEGVCYYLEPEAVDATLAFFRESGNANNTMVLDYAVPLGGGNSGQYHGGEEFHTIMEMEHPQERFKFYLDDEALEGFLSARGLKAASRMNPDQMAQAFLSGEEAANLGPVTGIFRFATLKKA